MLGLSVKGNNWKLIVANFFIVFLVQMAFQLDDVLSTGRLPTIFEVIKIMSGSLVTTLIFYGYARKKG